MYFSPFFHFHFAIQQNWPNIKKTRGALNLTFTIFTFTFLSRKNSPSVKKTQGSINITFLCSKTGPIWGQHLAWTHLDLLLQNSLVLHLTLPLPDGKPVKCFIISFGNTSDISVQYQKVCVMCGFQARDCSMRWEVPWPQICGSFWPLSGPKIESICHFYQPLTQCH